MSYERRQIYVLQGTHFATPPPPAVEPPGWLDTDSAVGVPFYTCEFSPYFASGFRSSMRETAALV